MFEKIKDGEMVEVGGLKCYLPPIGFGLKEERTPRGDHKYTLCKTDVIKRSGSAKQQYWEREPFPDWYDKRREAEQAVQESGMPKHTDSYCEDFRKQEWNRRMSGVWVYIKGRPTYLTGLHYFYVQYWSIDSNPPLYRECDRLFFYFLQHCIENPECLGMLSVAKRRSGKTMRSGVFTYEYVSRNKAVHGGIQSKTDGDAQEVYSKAILSPWTDLPHFFRPLYDTIGGDRPEKNMRFFEPSRKGSSAREGGKRSEEELRSWIDYMSRGIFGYDGKALHRYVSDECGKLKDVDIYKRHNVVRYCSTVNGRFIGKHLYTTTVEEIEDGGGRFKKLWDDSDHMTLKPGERTKTGLYRYFEPAYTIGDVDEYGFTDEDFNIKNHIKEREQHKSNREEYFGIIRRNAFTIEEALKFSNKEGLFDPEVLYDRIDALGIYGGYMERGNYVWEKGVQDTKVVWQKTSTGRWLRCWKMEESETNPVRPNNIVHRGGFFYPQQKNSFVIGVDPFSHSETEGTRKSMGAAFCMKKYDPADIGDFTEAFIDMYHARPKTVTIFHEDMLKMCVYYGCQLLLENNKNALLEYFKLRGYEAFLMKLRDYKEYGIPGNNATAERIVDLTEEHIGNSIHKVFYPLLCRQWIDFDFNNRTPSDLAMAAGYTLIAAHRNTYKAQKTGGTPMESLFMMHSIQ